MRKTPHLGQYFPKFAVILIFSATSSASFAQTAEQSRSTLLSQLSQCRQITADMDRLACMDAAAAALDQAERAGEVVVIEKVQIQAARRDLFGFDLPSLPNLFARSAEDKPLTSIETNLTRANQLSDGKWVFRLADGSEWRQIDSMPVRFNNRPDTPVRVRNAALGSYLLTLGSSRAVRVRRQ